MPSIHTRQQEVVVVDDNHNWWFSPVSSSTTHTEKHLHRRSKERLKNLTIVFPQAAFIVKWTIFAFIFLAFLLGILAYQHARRRIGNGQPPLKYHKVRERERTSMPANADRKQAKWQKQWMLSAAQRAPFEPHLLHHNQASFYRIPDNNGSWAEAAGAYAPPCTYSTMTQVSRAPIQILMLFFFFF